MDKRFCHLGSRPGWADDINHFGGQGILIGSKAPDTTYNAAVDVIIDVLVGITVVMLESSWGGDCPGRLMPHRGRFYKKIILQACHDGFKFL